MPEKDALVRCLPARTTPENVKPPAERVVLKLYRRLIFSEVALEKTALPPFDQMIFAVLLDIVKRHRHR